MNSIELNQRDNSLNLLRLLFATFVLVGHSFGMINAQNNLPSVLTYIMSLAVPCFFVVSGYLITGSAIKNSFKRFLTKRLARIYPAYFIMLLVVVIFLAPIDYRWGGGTGLLGYLHLDPSPIKFLLSNICLFLVSPKIGNTISSTNWNGSAWTLIFEFSCYIGIGVLIWILSKLKVKNRLKTISSIYLLLILISFFYPRPEGVLDRNIGNLFVTMVNLSSIFLGGSIVYLIKDKLVFSMKWFLLSILACTFIMSLLPQCWACELSAIPMIYIILFISVKLKSPSFIKKNDISYGLYIYAWPLQSLIADYILINGVEINVYLYILICWVVSAIFATVSWFKVEKPVLNKVNNT